MRTGWLALGGLLTGTALAVACGGESKLNVVVEEGANARRANLPAVPTLPPPPPAFAPGSQEIHTVYGVRHFAAKNWGKQVQLRGHIVQLHQEFVPNTTPPRLCAERDHCNEERPHVYLADSPTEQDQEKWIQVTGYAQFQYEVEDARRAARSGRPTPPANPGLGAMAPPTVPTDFYQGAVVTVRGEFVRRAPNGQANSMGLINYRSHTTDTPSPEDPAARRAAH
ncbi:MAG: hypothetical protein Q8Q09_20890 [Deltaproteobacteria bacterium]|nr:hypothetical protein [Deltaproteobacteria bacterium]